MCGTRWASSLPMALRAVTRSHRLRHRRESTCMAAALGPTDTDALGPILAEQVVVVTGGGRGLGRSIAEAFLREGARVVVNYNRSRAAAEHLAAAHAGRAIAVQADVRDRAQVDSLIAQAHRAFDAPVSSVVNN